MTDSAKGHAPILAAGGIVLRGKLRPRVAVVRLRREKAWVLPKGKLMPREHPRDGAKREVMEETGYNVSVHEFLGSMSYAAEGKIKIVQFWLMRALGSPVRDLMDDVKAVKWLPLQQAIATLSRPHEKVFLTHAGPIALGHFKKTWRMGSRGRSRNGGVQQVPPASVEHVIALDYEKTRPNAFAKALASWRSRAVQSSTRKAS
ncbi:MAG TPA: NUDIX domain-containing protein [Xanthobacteraceae bacterium]|nr:NUDIX domain-containing protein [Xanthobacteraceae bacterium]